MGDDAEDASRLPTSRNPLKRLRGERRNVETSRGVIRNPNVSIHPPGAVPQFSMGWKGRSDGLALCKSFAGVEAQPMWGPDEGFDVALPCGVAETYLSRISKIITGHQTLNNTSGVVYVVDLASSDFGYWRMVLPVKADIQDGSATGLPTPDPGTRWPTWALYDGVFEGSNAPFHWQMIRMVWSTSATTALSGTQVAIGVAVSPFQVPLGPEMPYAQSFWRLPASFVVRASEVSMQIRRPLCTPLNEKTVRKQWAGQIGVSTFSANKVAPSIAMVFNPKDVPAPNLGTFGASWNPASAAKSGPSEVRVLTAPTFGSTSGRVATYPASGWLVFFLPPNDLITPVVNKILLTFQYAVLADATTQSTYPGYPAGSVIPLAFDWSPSPGSQLRVPLAGVELCMAMSSQVVSSFAKLLGVSVWACQSVNSIKGAIQYPISYVVEADYPATQFAAVCAAASPTESKGTMQVQLSMSCFGRGQPGYPAGDLPGVTPIAEPQDMGVKWTFG